MDKEKNAGGEAQAAAPAQAPFPPVMENRDAKLASGIIGELIGKMKGQKEAADSEVDSAKAKVWERIYGMVRDAGFDPSSPAEVARYRESLKRDDPDTAVIVDYVIGELLDIPSGQASRP
jgi:hypothetical protein